MNVHAPNVSAPPLPRSLDELGLSMVTMRDILLKSMFRMNLDQVTQIARVCAVPVPLAQDLVDLARTQKLVEATGTLLANSGGEMGYRLSEAGKARALDALAQSEYYGAMPVPLAAYEEQTRRQTIRNVRITRPELSGAMVDMVIPDDLLAHLGPAVGSGRSTRRRFCIS